MLKLTETEACWVMTQIADPLRDRRSQSVLYWSDWWLWSQSLKLKGQFTQTLLDILPGFIGWFWFNVRDGPPVTDDPHVTPETVSRDDVFSQGPCGHTFVFSGM